LTVTAQTVASQTVTLLTADTDALLTWSRTGEFPRTVREALARAATLRQALASAERDIAEGNRLIAEIEAEQGRIRENMKTVAAGTQYYDRLLAKLNEQESRIEQLQRERAAATERRDARRVEFENFIAEIAVG
jgi:chromosome segregation ATPase